MKILKENIKGILAVLMLSISLSISATSKDTLNAVTKLWFHTNRVGLIVMEHWH